MCVYICVCVCVCVCAVYLVHMYVCVCVCVSLCRCVLLCVLTSAMSTATRAPPPPHTHTHTSEIVRRRRNFEYSLKRRRSRKEDYLKYIEVRQPKLLLCLAPPCVSCSRAPAPSRPATAWAWPPSSRLSALIYTAASSPRSPRPLPLLPAGTCSDRLTPASCSFFFQYELNVEALRRKRKQKRGVYKQNSASEYSIVRRIHGLFAQALKRFRVRLRPLRVQCAALDSA